MPLSVRTWRAWKSMSDSWPLRLGGWSTGIRVPVWGAGAKTLHGCTTVHGLLGRQTATASCIKCNVVVP
eukprot:3979264-Amphidinium_carterae.1